MKRSEMIHLIAKKIEGNYSWDGPKCRIHTEYAYYIAEAVLNAIERAGMLPPTTEFKLGDKIVRDNTWETEE